MTDTVAAVLVERDNFIQSYYFFGLSVDDVELTKSSRYKEIKFPTEVKEEEMAGDAAGLSEKASDLPPSSTEPVHTIKKIVDPPVESAKTVPFLGKMLKSPSEGRELSRVDNVFRKFVKECGKDFEEDKSKVKNLWFIRGEGEIVGEQPIPRSWEESSEEEEEEVKSLIPKMRYKQCLQEVVTFATLGLIVVDATEFGGSLDVAAVLDFVNSGHDLSITVLEVLSASPSAYSSNPKSKLSSPPSLTGSAISLVSVVQSQGEKLEDFSKKFLELARKVDNLDQKTAVTAFTNTFWLDCKAKEYLVLNKPTTLEEMITKVKGYVDLERMMSERQKSTKSVLSTKSPPPK
ncbi:hypothetical protein GIB67_014508 [Kingdonia uniflora]|uniref:Uncharacterized protein n=1 Tax=Kingdonia uniflora TaxID=39325 RepID=A0A7J7NMF3_9MAGN|nr:hypothetical protein GIB67_014508 [Kingdonia uniflora]